MKEIFIERRENILRIAVKVNNELVESIVEEQNDEPIIGEIYKARVKNILPAINSIFIDMGLSKEGYMYYGNDLKAANVKKGDDILVEVVKEPINDKGAKLSHKVSIPGKYVVLNCYNQGISFSKRITDEARKKEILDNIKPLDDVSITIRTEAVHASDEDLLAEKISLLSELEVIIKKLRYSLKLGKVYGENIILNKVIRENLGNECKIILNHEEDLYM